MQKDEYMISMMSRYGGSFVKALAECFSRADSNNYSKLIAAFPEYVLTYSTWGQKNETPTD